MKRCLTLGISLCLLGLLSGCCCGPRGLGRGCCSPSPCGQPFGLFQPFNSGCSSCGTGGGYGGVAPGYGGTPYGAVPSTYLPQQYGAATLTPEGLPVETTGLPPADGMPMTAYGQPTYNQFNPTTFNQPMMGQPAPFAESAPPVTTALMKPESLPTY